MALVAAPIAVERLLPWEVAANRTITGLLAVPGLAVAGRVGVLPGLTLPDKALMSGMGAGSM